MYSIVKDISYSTINSSSSMSSLCGHWLWRTTASERVKGPGTGQNANTQTYLNLFDYQSAPLVWEDENKRRVKSCNLSKEKKKKKALSYFLASTWQNWMKRRGGGGRVGHRQFQTWAEGRGPTPHSLSLPLPAAGAESEHDFTSCWLGTSGFLSQYSDPPTPPFILYTLHFSPMVLSFQLTKHLT